MNFRLFLSSNNNPRRCEPLCITGVANIVVFRCVCCEREKHVNKGVGIAGVTGNGDARPRNAETAGAKVKVSFVPAIICEVYLLVDSHTFVLISIHLKSLI